MQAEFQKQLNCLSVFAISITLVVTRIPKSGSHVIKGKLGLLNSGGAEYWQTKITIIRIITIIMVTSNVCDFTINDSNDNKRNVD